MLNAGTIQISGFCSSKGESCVFYQGTVGVFVDKGRVIELYRFLRELTSSKVKKRNPLVSEMKTIESTDKHK